MDLAALNLIAEKHIRTALEEDLNHGDVSAAAVVPAGAQATVELIAKQEGVIAGLDVFERTFHLLDPAVCVERFVADGSRVEVGQLLHAVRVRARISPDDAWNSPGSNASVGCAPSFRAARALHGAKARRREASGSGSRNAFAASFAWRGRDASCRRRRRSASACHGRYP